MTNYIADNKSYYPTKWSGCNPIHAVRDWAYVRKIVRAAIGGEEIPAILLDGERGSGSLLAGTHRCAANDILIEIGHEDKLIDYVVYDEDSASYALREAVESGDYEAIDEAWGDRSND